MNIEKSVKEVPVVLKHDYYLGIEYAILLQPYGYPAAYIKLNKNSSCYGMNCDQINEMVVLGNGDMTYSSSYLMDGFSTDGWWIGWDYGHFGDYSYTMPSGKKHPKEEILTDIFKSINEINKRKLN